MASAMNRFEIRFAWLESNSPDAIERVCAAELSIYVGDFCLTQLEDLHTQTVRPVVRASAYRLAFWFAQNWWRLRWEPEQNSIDWQMAHLLSAAGGGYTWPALSFIGDGENVLLRMRPNAVVPSENIRYIVQADIPVHIDPFVNGVDAFVDAVIGRLRASGHSDTDLERLWDEVRTERSASDITQWRKLEALASLDPDTDEAVFFQDLLGQQQAIGLGAIEEIVAVAKNKAQATLASLVADCRSNAVPLHFGDIDTLHHQTRDYVGQMATLGALGGTQSPPWQLGYDVAAMARRHWSLASGKLSNTVLDQLFGIPAHLIENPSMPTEFPLSAGYRELADDGHLAVWLGTRHATGRRFALARLVGDHLYSGAQERLLPATSAKTARQKFQRAFAQQFLCPLTDLREYLQTDNPDDEQIEDAANEFSVSPLLVKTTLVNHGLLGREALHI